jgi:Family of unknown function (DUF6298)
VSATRRIHRLKAFGAVVVAVALVGCTSGQAGAPGSDVPVPGAPGPDARGPLSVSSVNPRYFSVGSGTHERAVYLTGSNLWNNLQDGAGAGTCDEPAPPFDFRAYLDFLQAHEMNFVRLWRWEHVMFRLPPELDTGGPYCVGPHPWARSGPRTAFDGGPKFDLSRFNQAYFDRLRERVVEAGEHGVYVSVMLFEGFCLHLCDADTMIAGHPFDGQNNVNGIDIDTIADYQSSLVARPVLALQHAYIRKVVDTLSDLDNVLYEVSNESWKGSVEWQYDVIDYVNGYEAARGYAKHPVGMSSIWPGGRDSDLFASPADWVMPGDLPLPPGGDYRDDPPASDGTKVIISDDDHYAPCEVDAVWAWKSFARGLNPDQLDCGIPDPVHLDPDFDYLEPVRLAQGDTRRLADKMNLLSMEPRGDLSSTGYALVDPGREYLVVQPATTSAPIVATLVPGKYTVQWFSINGRTTRAAGTITITRPGEKSFSAPSQTPTPGALYLRRVG